MYLASSCHGNFTLPKGAHDPVALEVIGNPGQNGPCVLAVRVGMGRNFLPGMEMPDHDYRIGGFEHNGTNRFALRRLQIVGHGKYS